MLVINFISLLFYYSFALHFFIYTSIHICETLSFLSYLNSFRFHLVLSCLISTLQNKAIQTRQKIAIFIFINRKIF